MRELISRIAAWFKDPRDAEIESLTRQLRQLSAFADREPDDLGGVVWVRNVEAPNRMTRVQWKARRVK
jgi:hypothetical protein